MNHLPASANSQPIAASDTPGQQIAKFEASNEMPGIVIDKLPDYDRPHDPYSNRIHDPSTLFVRSDNLHQFAGVESDDGMIKQGLRLLIKAGEEVFGVVRVDQKHMRPDDGPGAFGVSGVSALVRFRSDGETPELVGALLPGHRLTVGRNATNDYSGSTSRTHFTITDVSTGEIRVTDTNSANGTTIVRSDEFDKAIMTQREQSTNPLIENSVNWTLDTDMIKQVKAQHYSPDIGGLAADHH